MNYFGTLLLGVTLLVSCSSEPERIDLSGEWTFTTDSLDRGIKEQWFNKTFDEQVVLPGSMATNGKGNDVDVNTHWTGNVVDKSWFHDEKYASYREPGNIKIPFWLQPVKKYYGAAWYQKQFEVPESWKGKKILLTLERCHWETQVWLNGEKGGMRNSLSTPNVFDLTSLVKSGANKLVVRIDNRVKTIDPGANAHSISDHTQSNWNGMVGTLYVEARPKVYIKRMSLHPQIKEKSVRVKLLIDNGGEAGEVRVFLNAKGREPLNLHDPAPQKETLSLEEDIKEYVIDYSMGEEVKLWDEFAPHLYTMEVELDSEAGKDLKVDQFGMRDFSVDGTQFAVNGRPLFLRGTLECAIFPKTGYPATGKAEWARIYKVIKAHGLNHVRFHSWCPPEAAFQAADEAGVYLQVESASWATIGDGAPIDTFIYQETHRIIEAYGNHPSFCMMAYGNEPGGSNQGQYLTDYVHHFTKEDQRRVFTGAAGWPVLEANQYHNLPGPRIQGWGEGLNSLINREPPRTDFSWQKRIEEYHKPVVSHEIGQWCVYPNLKETPKYTGVLKAKNFEIFSASLAENGMAHLADSFLWASGKLQALCYKHDIEAALRTPGFGGFQLLALNDFPGQGTALVGVLDPFWEEKGYITPDEFSRFCNTTVPLMSLPHMVFTEGQTLRAVAEVAHFGSADLINQQSVWKLATAGGQVVASGKLPIKDIPTGALTSLGAVVHVFKAVERPQMLRLSLKVADFENGWDVWVYPKVQPLEVNRNVLVTRELDKKALATLGSGGKVLLTPRKGTLTARAGGDIAVGFSSIFWNTAWTRNQPPHTLGVLVNPEHPMFRDFPTQYHSNWQWWDAMTWSNAIVLSQVDDRIQPLVRVIDDWFTNRPLALLFEARVGKGKLMVSGIDFLTDMENRPAGKQLLQSVLNYMDTPGFNPEITVEAEKIKALF